MQVYNEANRNRRLIDLLTTASMNLLHVCVLALIRSAVADDSSENNTPVPEMIASNGYPVEVHHVRTGDGYTLEAHRMRSLVGARAPPVLFMHGMMTSSFEWVCSGPGKALAYLLADCGYDVWMGNARGNTYSRNMTNMTLAQRKGFWNYSVHEIGFYDITALIDYILAITGQLKLTYVGFSQGVTAFLIMMSMRPEYNDKVVVCIGTSPVVYLTNSTSLLMKMFDMTTTPDLLEISNIFQNCNKSACG